MKLSKFENNYLNKLEPYKLASHEIWNEKRDVVKVDWNESTKRTSEVIINAIVQKINSPGLNYYPNLDNTKLKNYVSEYTKQNVKNILLTPSSDNAHEIIVNAFMHPADICLVIGPTYDNFRVVCESKGINVKCVNYFESDKTLDDYINEIKPRLIYICNPNNPTGDIIEKDIIEQIVKNNTDKLFVIDEAYYEFERKTATNLVSEYDNIIITRTLSKAFSLAGVRFGYIVSNKKIINSMNKIVNHKNLPTVTQIAAEAAFECVNIMNEYVVEVNEQKKQFYSELDSKFSECIEYKKSSANYVLMRFNSKQMKESFLEVSKNNNIYVRDIGHIGLLNSVRITIGDALSMQKIYKMMEEWKNGYI